MLSSKKEVSETAPVVSDPKMPKTSPKTPKIISRTNVAELVRHYELSESIGGFGVLGLIAEANCKYIYTNDKISLTFCS